MTLAALRRSIKVGTKIELTHARGAGPGEIIPWGRGLVELPFTREVAVVQSQTIAFDDERAHDGRSWMWWPRASGVSFGDDGSFTIDSTTYRIVP